MYLSYTRIINSKVHYYSEILFKRHANVRIMTDSRARQASPSFSRHPQRSLDIQQGVSSYAGGRILPQTDNFKYSAAEEEPTEEPASLPVSLLQNHAGTKGVAFPTLPNECAWTYRQDSVQLSRHPKSFTSVFSLGNLLPCLLGIILRGI